MTWFKNLPVGTDLLSHDDLFFVKVVHLVCDSLSLYWCVAVYLKVLNLFSKGFFKSEKSVSFIVWVVGGISGSLKCKLFVLVCDKKWAEHLKHASSYLWSLRTPAQDNSSPLLPSLSSQYMEHMWQKQLHMTQLQKTKDQKLKMPKKVS